MDGLFLEEYKRVARDLGATERVDVIRLEGSPHLQLNGNCTTRFAAHVQDLDAVAIVQALQAASTGVETMDFSYNFLGNRAATTLAEFIRKDSALNALNLAFNEITSAGGRALAQALVINKSITHLNLQGNDIGEEGGMAIADMLPANPTLRTLNLSSCGIKTGTIIGLATALREHPSLTSLNIDKPLLPGVQEGLSVATHLSGMIKVNTALTELHMSKWKMNDDQLELMLPSLTANKGIVYLDLSCNNLSSIGATFVSTVLSKRADIVHLNLSSNKMGDEGATALARVLRNHQTVQYLDLTSNGIEGRGLVAVAEMMDLNTSILHLKLWGNTFSEEACAKFHALKGRLERLLTVDFDMYTVDEKAQVLLKTDTE